jgi:glycosyltransferase involved in cell wall biosynthesis
MPSYNVASYIGGALESLFAQSFQDFEVIVVNDGSPDTDALLEALTPYRSRILYFEQPNRGVAAARNAAIRAAGGEWIASLDPDDLWEPQYLATQIAYIDSHPGLDLVYADAVIFGPVPEAGRTAMDLWPSRGEVTFESLATQECAIIHCAALTRRESVLRVGLFDESLPISEDFDLWLRLVKAGGRIGYHHAALARYRRRPDSLTADRLRTYSHYLLVLDKAASKLPLTPRERSALENQRRQVGARAQLVRGQEALARGDCAAAIPLLREASTTLRQRKLALAVMLLRVAPGLGGWLLGKRYSSLLAKDSSKAG